MAGTVSTLLVRPVVAALPSADALWRATDRTPDLVADRERA